MTSWDSGYARTIGDARHSHLLSGRVAHWAPLLGPTGGTLRDVSRTVHGTLTNMTLSTAWTNRRHWSLLFAGSGTDRVVTTQSVNPSLLTVAVWINFVSFVNSSVGRGIATAAVWATNGWAMYEHTGNPSNGFRCFVALDTGLKVTSSALTLTVNTWHLGTMTFDGATLRVYVDGGESASTAASGSMDYTGVSDVRIGGRHGGDVSVNARIAEVMVWNRPLRAVEVRQLYTLGPGGSLEVRPVQYPHALPAATGLSAGQRVVAVT